MTITKAEPNEFFVTVDEDKLMTIQGGLAAHATPVTRPSWDGDNGRMPVWRGGFEDGPAVRPELVV